MTAAVHIRDAVDLVAAERASLSVLGRALTASERQRLHDLEQALSLLTEAIALLEQDRAPNETSQRLDAGRYSGSGAEVAVELRVDNELGITSGDLYAVSSQPGTDEPLVGYAASFRSSSQSPPLTTSGNPLPITVEDDLGGLSGGSIAILPQQGHAANGTMNLTTTITLDRGLNGLPGGQPITLEIQHRGSSLRALTLEIDREELVEPIGPVVANGTQQSLPSVLRDAGLELELTPPGPPIPPKPAGWDSAELHALMLDVANRPVDRIGWELGLLVLGRANARHDGLLGVMFDTTPTLPRQAAAVFASTVRERRPHDADRKLLQTTIHELGHALNLVHRFEREVGRADSFSHMAYDWRHRDGRQAFWDNYEFSFDVDELELIRHGRRRSVAPGGAPFHSVRYWADGDGGYSPYVPETPLEGVALQLGPPPSSMVGGSPVFAYGQPVFLQVSFQNLLDNSLEINPQILDHKVGLLEILIRRDRSETPVGLAGADPFVPIVQRCVDIDPGTADVVPPGGVITNNLNLTFGASGFGFAEPGRYEVTALLVVPEIRNGVVAREYIVASPPLPITVAHPVTSLDNESANVLLDADVGAWFALGGSPALPKAADKLAELADQRGNDPGKDPVVAAIVRTQAFEAMRTPVRFDEKAERFTVCEPNEDTAAARLTALDDSALRHFDDATADSMRQLAESFDQ